MARSQSHHVQPCLAGENFFHTRRKDTIHSSLLATTRTELAQQERDALWGLFVAIGRYWGNPSEARGNSW